MVVCASERCIGTNAHALITSMITKSFFIAFVFRFVVLRCVSRGVEFQRPFHEKIVYGRLRGSIAEQQRNTHVITLRATDARNAKLY